MCRCIKRRLKDRKLLDANPIQVPKILQSIIVQDKPYSKRCAVPTLPTESIANGLIKARCWKAFSDYCGGQKGHCSE